MKILYASCHSVLENDELRLLTELDTTIGTNFNIEVFSMGAFSNPTQAGDYLRGVIPKGHFYPDLYSVYMQCSKDLIHPELVKWCDVFLCMHNSAVPGQKSFQPWIVNNYRQFKEGHKRVIWRSIGQSTPSIERELAPFRKQGMQIVRYSPHEEKIPEYAGHDAIIRFYKDSVEYNNWIGNRLQVIAIAQSFKKRGEHLGFSVFDRVTANFQRKVFGTENSDLADINGGQISFQHLKNELRENRVFFYYGTQPAPYTLSLIEAMMTGIPVVCAGSKLRDTGIYRWPHYEVPEIISNGVNGYFSDSYDELVGYIDLLMKDYETAKRIGQAGRETAIKLFDKTKIMNEWAEFLNRK